MIGDGDLSVGGDPTFAGKGFGGGGFGIMDLGGQFTQAMMDSNPNFTPNLYGLPTKDRATGAPINYGTGFEGTVPGGHEFSGETGVLNNTPTVETWAKPIEGVPLFMQNALSMQMDPSSMLTPNMPSFTEPATGIFGGTLGPKLKNSLPGRIITGALRINPGTRGLMMGISLLRGLKNAENPAEFLRQGFTRMALSRALGGKGLGLSSLQRQGVGSLINMARGKQTLGQSIKSLGTSAAFQKAAPSLFKLAYDKGGANAVYGVASLLSMAQRAAQQRIAKGPGGGG